MPNDETSIVPLTVRQDDITDHVPSTLPPQALTLEQEPPELPPVPTDPPLLDAPPAPTDPPLPTLPPVPDTEEAPHPKVPVIPSAITSVIRRVRCVMKSPE